MPSRSLIKNTDKLSQNAGINVSILHISKLYYNQDWKKIKTKDLLERQLLDSLVGRSKMESLFFFFPFLSFEGSLGRSTIAKFSKPIITPILQSLESLPSRSN